MNLKKFLRVLFTLAVFTLFVSASAFAQTYVSATDGDDINGDGTLANPYQTIAAGITAAGNGGTVVVEPGDYNETVTVPDDMTFRAEDFGGTLLNTVTINGLVINTTNASDVVSFGETGLNFLIETTNDLTLTKGVLNISAARVSLQSGATITRTAGSINATPTFTNISVVYNGTEDIAAGPELPADLGTGNLTVNITAGKTLSVTNSLTSTGITGTTGHASFTSVTTKNTIAIAAGNYSFSGTLTSNNQLIQNNGAGTLTIQNLTYSGINAALAGALDNSAGGNIIVNGNLAFNNLTGNGANNAVSILNDGGGDMTLQNGFTLGTSVSGGTTYRPFVSITNTTGDFAANGSIEAQALSNAGGTFVLTGGSGTTLNNDVAAGVVELKANFTLSGATVSNNHATAVVKLNTHTLTLSNANVAITNTGNFISAAAATIGFGTISITGNQATTSAGGELPNINIASGKELEIDASVLVWGNITNNGTLDIDADIDVKGNVTNSSAIAIDDAGNVSTLIRGNLTSTGGITLGTAGITVYGDYSQNAGGTLNLGARIFAIQGDWFRDSNVLGDVTPGTGTLTFQGAGDVDFTPGAQLTLFNVIINKTAVTDEVTLAQSVTVTGDFNINGGTLNLNNHLRMTGTSKTFTNNAGGYNSTNPAAFLILESGGAFAVGPHGAGTSNVLTGSAVFSNIDVRSATDVYLGSNINVSGTIILRSGQLDVANKTLTFSNDLVTVPKLIRHNAGAITDLGVAGGTTAVEAGVDYDLEYTGIANIAATALDWIANEVNNLTVSTTGGRTVTNQAASTVAGILTVGGTEILDIQNGALTLTGDNKTHLVNGTVQDGAAAVDNLVVTGDGVTINGGTATTDARTIELLTVNLGAAAETFTLQNIINLALLTHTQGTSSINLVDDGKAVVVDNATLSAFDINGGAVTLTLNGATPDAVGASTLDGGSLTLGSDVVMGGALTQGTAAAATLNLDNFDLTVLDYTFANATSAVNANAGILIVNATAGARTVTLTNALSIPNVEVIGAGNGVDVTTNNLTVTNSFTHTSGVLDLNGINLIVTGNTYVFTAGSYLSTGGDYLSDIQLKGAALTLTAAANMDFTSGATDPELVINSTGTVTFQTSVPATARTFTVGKLTQTAGNIELGINSMVLNGAASGYVRVAGNVTMSSGWLVLNSGTLTINPAAGGTLSIDNLEIQANAATVTNHAFTIAKALKMTAGTFTSAANGNITISNGATITRVLTTALLSHTPSMGTGNKMIYSGAENANITTDKELASTVVEFTVNRSGAADDVVLGKNLTVSSKLTLTDGQFSEGAFALTLGDGATLSRTGDGSFLAGSVPAVTNTYNLEYTGNADILTADEDFFAGLANFTVNTTAPANVKLHANRNISGNFSLTQTNNAVGNGHFDLNANIFNVAGNVTLAANSRITNTGAALAQFGFNGAAAQNFTIPAGGLNFPYDHATTVAGVELVLNNTSTEGVTLLGGNLVMQNNNPTNETNIVRFIKGNLNTGSRVLTLWHNDDGAGNVVQGFARAVAVGDYSHVVGNVRKYLNAVAANAAVRLTRVEYPVGTAGNYRPMAFQFNTLPTANFNLTINHVNASPEGTNGFPLTSGDLTITNYPDLYWLVTSDLTLQPSVAYDIEARADGYSDYQSDGVQNIRLIRRFDTNIDNPWSVQGGTNYDNSSYDYLGTPGILSDDSPIIVVRNAVGAISTQGTRFTYSQLNKAPVVSSPADVAVAENNAISITWTKTDPDIGQTPTFTGVSWTATAPAVVPTAGTGTGQYQFNAATGALTWTPSYEQAGAYTVTVTATDGVLNTTDVVAITVTDADAAPVFSAPTAGVASAITLGEGTTQVVQFTAANTGVVTLSLLSQTPAAPVVASFVASTGVLTVAPGFDAAATSPYTVVVRASGEWGKTTDYTLTVNVDNVNQVPVFAAVPDDQSITNIASYTFDYNATDGDSDPLAYSLVGVNPAMAGSATVDADGILLFTPAFGDAGKTFAVTVRVTDGTANVDDIVNIEVTQSAVLGDADGNSIVQAADAVLVLEHTVGINPLTTEAQLYSADADGNSVVNAFDAYYILYYVANNNTWPPVAKIAAVSGEAKFGRLTSDVQNNIVSLPISLTNASNIYSAYVELNVNEEFAGMKGISVLLPEGWISVSNYADGKLKIAMTGMAALKDGDFAVVNLTLKDKEDKFDVAGAVAFNGEFAKDMGTFTVKHIPAQFGLSQNYPNPFNPATKIRYQLAVDTKVSLSVYDMLGQKVATIVNAIQEAGYYTAEWNGSNDFGHKISSGIYIYRLEAGDFVKTMKMNLLK